MSILDFIDWCQGPGVYDWAMKSCHEACSKIFEEQKTENKCCNFQNECKLVKTYKKSLEEIELQADKFAEYYGEYPQITKIGQILKNVEKETK